MSRGTRGGSKDEGDAAAAAATAALAPQMAVGGELAVLEYYCSDGQMAYQRERNSGERAGVGIFFKDATPKADHWLTAVVGMAQDAGVPAGGVPIEMKLCFESEDGGEPVVIQGDDQALLKRLTNKGARGGAATLTSSSPRCTIHFRIELGSYRRNDRKLQVRFGTPGDRVAACFSKSTFVMSKKRDPEQRKREAAGGAAGYNSDFGPPAKKTRRTAAGGPSATRSGGVVARGGGAPEMPAMVASGADMRTVLSMLEDAREGQMELIEEVKDLHDQLAEIRRVVMSGGGGGGGGGGLSLSSIPGPPILSRGLTSLGTAALGLGLEPTDGSRAAPAAAPSGYSASSESASIEPPPPPRLSATKGGPGHPGHSFDMAAAAVQSDAEPLYPTLSDAASSVAALDGRIRLKRQHSLDPAAPLL